MRRCQYCFNMSVNAAGFCERCHVQFQDSASHTAQPTSITYFLTDQPMSWINTHDLMAPATLIVTRHGIEVQPHDPGVHNKRMVEKEKSYERPKRKIGDA